MCGDLSWQAGWQDNISFPRAPVFANQPSLLAGKMLLALILDPLRRSVGDPYANGGKTRFQSTFGPVSPAHILPLGIGEHIFGCCRQDVRNVPLAWTPASSSRPDQLDVDRVHLQVTRDAARPCQPACRKPLSKRRTETVSCIRKHTTEAHARCHRAIDLGQSDLWLGSRHLVFDRYAGAP